MQVGATRLPVVTGGPAPPVPRAEAPRSDGFATRNAAATSRHGAYWRPPVVGTVPSGERPVVADCGDLNRNS